MVEGAICAAIAIVFNLLFAYVPFMGIILNLIMPLPLVVCGMRNGMRWSIMAAVVSTVLVAMTVNPIHALFYIGVYGVMGIVLGECMHRHLPAQKLLLYASIGALASIGINMLLALYVMGIHPVDMMFKSLDDAIPQIAASFNTGSMTPEQSAAFTAQMTEMVSMIKIILPGAMLLMAPILVMINYWVARRILARTGETFPEFPPVDEWSFPPVVALVYVAALFGIQFFVNNRTHIGYTICANVWAICSMLLMVQGLVFIYWYLKTHNKPLWWMRVLIPVSKVPRLDCRITYEAIRGDWNVWKQEPVLQLERNLCLCADHCPADSRTMFPAAAVHSGGCADIHYSSLVCPPGLYQKETDAVRLSG